ncbi:E3 ubiquitin-protein ligase TRIM15-like [Neopsephotus bourkii]|uniref:E3 ubiquitin-protein ligase TRIM15-like n=1 Tax=Neopsephotus bourkii TaxID=309878 RepID=UPI002AA55E37|nr:E3 ubiquitin-protein ligase TRIM15-like [Neopsephotus bourkii]
MGPAQPFWEKQLGDEQQWGKGGKTPFNDEKSRRFAGSHPNVPIRLGAEHGNSPGVVRGPATNIQPRGSHLSHLLLLERPNPAQDQAAMEEQPLAAATERLGRPIEVYEERLQSHLRALRKVLAELLDWRMSEEKQRTDYLARSEAERGRIRAEFERLRRLLVEKESAALARLAELDAAFEAAQEEKSSRVAEGIARLHVLIGQLEAKRLPQDIGSILNRYVAPSPHLCDPVEHPAPSCLFPAGMK